MSTGQKKNSYSLDIKVVRSTTTAHAFATFASEESAVSAYFVKDLVEVVRLLADDVLVLSLSDLDGNHLALGLLFLVDSIQNL